MIKSQLNEQLEINKRLAETPKEPPKKPKKKNESTKARKP